MDPNNHSDLPPVLEALSDIVPRLDISALTAFISEVLTWNPQLGLVSKQQTPAVIARLVRQSTELFDFCWGVLALPPNTVRGIDIGSGAGFPGVVWKMLEPGLRLVLVERKTRRAAFLDRLIARLGWNATVRVVEGDIRELARTDSFSGAFNLATMMAVTSPEALVKPLERLLAPAGVFCGRRRSTDPAPPPTLGALRREALRRTTSGMYVAYRRRDTPGPASSAE